MRKILVLLILFAGSVVIFPSFQSGTSLSGALFIKTRPSDHPLPTAWRNQQGLQVAGAAAAAGTNPRTVGSSINENCGDPYQIRPGETLSKIAKTCGVSLAQLL